MTLGAALALVTLLGIVLQSQLPANSDITSRNPTAHRRSLRALQQQLDPAVQLLAVPRPSADQISNFRKCLDDYVSGKTTSSSGSIVTEQGRRSQLTVTLQQDSRFAVLKNLNAQKRGEKLQPLAFAEPGSTADVAALVRCSAGAGLKFTARNGGHHYEANSLLDNGVVIDMNKLQELIINAKDSTMVLGAGQKLVSLRACCTLLVYIIWQYSIARVQHSSNFFNSRPCNC